MADLNFQRCDKTEESEKEAQILFKEECYAIQGAIFDVYKEMGPGFLEAVYQECLERELSQRGLPFESQKALVLSYKGEPLVHTYTPDLVCFGKVIVELKAVKEIAPEHRAQVFNYLKASQIRLGLLVNFGHHPRVEIERIIL